ncbi:uncharacterized protein LOC105665262 [Ceratitis capitata]|uniref:uncharacterized protein LOC105665262 n=1 Tax=Ceratitis capitata TaxID=7213 RepID=UPI000C6C8689|nr:uncharacterized protein LOC105665262 [Ceratitis capitata]
MFKILKIIITLSIAVNCIAAESLHSICENNICYCKEGTHNATSATGQQYCALDKVEPCTPHAVRISPKVCECIKGYEYKDFERTTCVRSSKPGWKAEATTETSIDDFTDDYLDEISERNKPNEEDVKLKDLPTTTYVPTTTITTTHSVTTTKQAPADETNCNKFYLWVGVAIIAIAALVSLTTLCCLWNR